MQPLTIPNVLTLSRILLTAFFFSAGLQNEWNWALWLYGIAAFTDMLDGAIARLLHQKSRLGAFLDPMADKLMMLGGVVLLSLQGILPWWLMALIIGRDMLIVFGVFYIQSRGIEIQYRPTLLSKGTTFSQILTIVVGLIVAAVNHGVSLPRFVTFGLAYYPWILGVTAIMTLVTAVQYTTIGVRLLRSLDGRDV